LQTRDLAAIAYRPASQIIRFFLIMRRALQWLTNT
jgi:hypothetical protein